MVSILGQGAAKGVPLFSFVNCVRAFIVINIAINLRVICYTFERNTRTATVTQNYTFKIDAVVANEGG